MGDAFVLGAPALPQITMLTAGILVSLQMWFKLFVTVQVDRFGRSEDNAGVQRLEVAVRRYGDLVESAPILLVMLLLMELSGLARTWMIASAAVAVLGRLCHAIGITIAPEQRHPLKSLGALSTVFLGLDGGAWLVWHAIAYGVGR